MRTTLWSAAALAWLAVAPVARAQDEWVDPSPHDVLFVAAEQGVTLEVLDWGGSGRPLVFIPGLNMTAHSFDDIAPKLASYYHVYGITRRGFGASSVPEAGYGADRLGDDVIAVLDRLEIERPVLAGHSMGGAELSSIRSRHPERVAGLVYLDAAWQFAFDDGRKTPERTYLELDQTLAAIPEAQMTGADRVTFEAVRDHEAEQFGAAAPLGDYRQRGALVDGRVELRAPVPVLLAILQGEQKYTDVRAPALALIAQPQRFGPIVENSTDPEVVAAVKTWQAAKLNDANVFEAGMPTARIVRLEAAHLIHVSNEDEVIAEMRSFIDALPN